MEDWQLAAVADALKRASDVGETLTRAALQEECGIGAGDLEETMDVLRDRGGAWEVEPGVYSAGAEPVVADEDPATARAVAELEAEERAAMNGPPASTPAPAVGGAPLPGRPRTAVPPVAGPVRIEMPMGVAGGMDAAALGSLVQSGIEQAKAAQQGFVFEAKA